MNHLPIVGLAVAVVVLAVAMLSRSRKAVLLALVLVGLLAGSTWPTIAFGERGYKRARAIADADGKLYLQYHMELGNRWNKWYYATAALALFGTGAAWKWPRLLPSVAALSAALAVMSLAAGWIIAESGGRVRHLEFRTGLPPGQTDHCAHLH